MAETIIQIPGKLVAKEYGTKLANASDLDNDVYGPYASVSAAHAALQAKGLNTVGTTVGISGSNNTVVEYWYQGGTAQENLVEKSSGGGGSEQIQSDWNQTDSTKKDFIKNKPNIPDTSDYYTKSQSDEKYQPKGNYQPAGNYATKTELNSKVDNVPGKGLSTNDYTNEDKAKVAAAITEHQDISGKANTSDVNAALALKADKSEVTAEQNRAMAAEENLRMLYNNLQQSQPEPVTVLPAQGEAGKIYRLAGSTSYADYMYNENDLTTPIKMAEYDNAIDDEPTAGSNNLVKSGGIYKKINDVTSKIGITPITNCLFYNVLNTKDEDYVLSKIISSNGNYYSDSHPKCFTSGYIECSSKMRFRGISTSITEFWVCFYNKDKVAISSAYIHLSALYFEVPDDANISFMRVSMLLEKSGSCLFNSDILFSTKVEYNKPIIVCDYITANYIEDKILTGIENRFIENIFNPNDEDIIEGAYVNPSNGNVLSNTTTFVTGYIPCKEGDYLAWNGDTTSRLCAFYDSNKVFIRGYYDGQLNPYTTVPVGIGDIAYIRFSVPNSYKTRALYKNDYNASYIGYGNVAIIIDDIFLPDGSLLSKLQNILQSISTLNTKIENITNNLVFIKNVLNENDEDYVQNRIINHTDGNFYSDTYIGYATSGFIPCSSGDIFTVLNKVNFEHWECFYDVNKIRVNGSTSVTSELVVPDNDNIAYLRVSYKVSTIGKYLYNTSVRITSTLEYGDNLLVADDLKVNSVSASQIILNGKDISEKDVTWEYACCRPICIGDSLTDGLYVPDSQGHYTQGLINENYPYFLGRMLNCEVFNAGKNGSHPSKFYTEWYPLLDFTDYDTVILWLGTNGGLNTADSEAANYTPEKEGYYYTQIIDGILSQNPTIKIILMTVFIVGEISSRVEHGTVSVTNNFINDIASTYNLQVIDMSDLTTSLHPELRNNISNTHFAKAGNIYIANRICNDLYTWFNSNPIRCEFGLTQKPAHNP